MFFRGHTFYGKCMNREVPSILMSDSPYQYPEGSSWNTHYQGKYSLLVLNTSVSALNTIPSTDTPIQTQ
jgi:hypothetical protein